MGITAVSPSLPAYEREQAWEVARWIGAWQVEIESHELEDPNYLENIRALFFLQERGLFLACRLCEGERCFRPWWTAPTPMTWETTARGGRRHVTGCAQSPAGGRIDQG